MGAVVASQVGTMAKGQWAGDEGHCRGAWWHGGIAVDCGGGGITSRVWGMWGGPRIAGVGEVVGWVDHGGPRWWWHGLLDEVGGGSCAASAAVVWAAASITHSDGHLNMQPINRPHVHEAI